MKNLRKLLVCIGLCFLGLSQVQAKEGMYLLSDIPELMPELLISGCDCFAEQLYSADGTSLANQVPHFGRGCSSEIVSANGLLLTNYHCAHGSIQSVSSVEHDYLKNGFWAKDYKEELPVEGLSVRIPIKVVDITKEVTAQIKDLEGKEKEEALNKFVSRMIQYEKSKASDISASVRRVLGGTKYVLFVSRIFRDIRLVGVPPVSLGKFGGDRDNWMWPRHTADFTFLRIYAAKDGSPADFSTENKPLNTPHYIHISTKGVNEDDFVFILGYPGSTNKYSTSFEVMERQNITNTIRHKVRTEKLRVMKDNMSKNDTVRIKYSSKQASVSNYWKHAKAQNESFERINILEKKAKKEADFMKWVNESPERQAEYKDVFVNIKEALADRKDILYEYILAREALAGMDLVAQCRPQEMEYYFDAKLKDKYREAATRFYKNIDVKTEKEIIAALLKVYFETTKIDFLSDIKGIIDNEYNGDYNAYAQAIVSESPFSNLADYNRIVLENGDKERVSNDKMFKLSARIDELLDKLSEDMEAPSKRFMKNEDLYKKGIAESATELLAPDANSTIRLTYGKVKGFSTEDNVSYPFFTTLDGVIKKYESDSAYYKLPKEFVELYRNKNFGNYAVNGSVPTCFLATTHTTGGNSGSPVFNAKRELVGLLFDGNSQGLSGDYQFDENYVRSIIVDIRYVLYITEMFGKSEHIMKDIVSQKSKQ